MIARLRAACQHFQPTPVGISSAANPRLRQLRGLLESARERRRQGQTVLDGWHLLEAWLHQGGAVQQLVLPRRTWLRLDTPPLMADRSEASSRAALDGLATSRWLVLDDALFDALDILPSPVPVLALVDAPAPALPAQLDAHRDVVILDRVQDPGNVGAIIRTAAAAGIRTLLTTPGTAACWSPKVLRAGMGGHFVLAIHEGIVPADLPALLRQPLAGTVLDGGQSLHAQDLRVPLAWVFGNEGEGIDPALQARLGLRLTIPQAAGVESLNVAAAAAVCLFEQRRQRLAA
ncbi:MAG: RNA methyltransferase [Lautropia sp.]|nr:RNA methyltransferase [Lautropia sp.]